MTGPLPSDVAPKVELIDVQVELGGNVLVRNLDLLVEASEWLCVVGPNGAGKTTLLRAVTGALPHQGTIRLADQDLGRLTARRRARLVASVPQHPLIPSGTSVLDYVLLGRTAHIPRLGTERHHDREVVAEVLERLELTDLADREIATLSGGERQRAVIGRALAQQAPILVLDEPTTGLDLGHQQQVLGLVDELRHERGLTVISAMHDLTLAAQHAQRFVLLDRGRVVATGSAPEVFEPGALGRVFGASVAVLDDGRQLLIVPRRSDRGASAASKPEAPSKTTAAPSAPSRN
jgi:iron complex transport system ATP-binding protein